MAVSAVVAVGAASVYSSYKANEDQKDAQRKAEKKQKQEMERQRKLDAKLRAEEKAEREAEAAKIAAATPFGGNAAAARIGAEKMYAKRSRGRGRMGTIKGRGTSLG